MLDKRTTKARLLKIELRHVKLMLHELTQARYKKMFKEIAKGEKLQSDVLTVEEQKMCIVFLHLQKHITISLKIFFEGNCLV